MVALTDLLLAQLAERLSSQDVSRLAPLAGGASSLTYAGHSGHQSVVVKVAPPGVPPTAHRDVLRQARLITALRPTAVPVPEILFEDAGDPPDVPPLFVMSFLEGINSEPLFDGIEAGSESIVRERFQNAARVMARLHSIEPGALGLTAEPVIGPLDEVERWCRTLETIDAELAWGWQDVAAALRTSAPPALPAAIVHGDFRLGNLLAEQSRISAVIDWEIWSVGDPRVDVGWFLINCDPRTYGRSTRYTKAVPPVDDLAAVYRQAMGSVVPELNWFCALACFKSTATWSLIVKHNRRRSTPDAELAAMAPVLPRLLARASEFLG